MVKETAVDGIGAILEFLNKEHFKSEKKPTSLSLKFVLFKLFNHIQSNEKHVLTVAYFLFMHSAFI